MQIHQQEQVLVQLWNPGEQRNQIEYQDNGLQQRFLRKYIQERERSL